jgi:hypothetical protein
LGEGDLAETQNQRESHTYIMEGEREP